MNATKVFIAVLVVLAVLFFIGAGASFLGGESKNSGTPEPWVERLGDLIAKPRPLRFDEITSSCPVGETLLVSGACEYAIAESGDAVRRRTLTLVQGNSAEVTLEQPGSVLVRHRLQGATREANLDFFKKGGTLRIACAGGGIGGCRFQFEATE